MALLRRRPDLPDEFHGAWWAFLDCADAIEAGRRVLLGTLPAGRVEPAPVTVGIDALRTSVADVRIWMPDWRLEVLDGAWVACGQALDDADSQLDTLASVAAHTDELEELLDAVGEVVAPLDAFADAERDWRRQWRPPRHRPAT